MTCGIVATRAHARPGAGGRDRRPRSLLHAAMAAGLMLLCASVASLAAEPRTDASALQQAEALIDAWPERDHALADAQAIVDALLARDPAVSEGYRLRAMIHMRRGFLSGQRYTPDALEHAERSVDRAIALDARNDRAYVLRSQVYEASGRDPQARADLARAEAIAPHNPWVHFGWVDHLIAERKWNEATRRCREGARLRPDDKAIQSYGKACLIDIARHSGDVAGVEALYRAQIADDPARAWPRGEYARFLQCLPGRQDDAIAQARGAIAVMDYPIVHKALAVALYVRWAGEMRAGQRARAEATWREARAEGELDVAALIEGECGGAPWYGTMIALRDSGRARMLSPEQAIPLAAKRHEADGAPVPGTFRIQVQATGRDHDAIFLNSLPDYRDPRCLTVRFSAKGIEAFRRTYGVDPDAYYKGKTIVVVGLARRHRIELVIGSATAESHYFQTRIDVTDIEQIRLLEDVPPSPDLG